MLEMFKVLGKLKKADRFWPWLYGIALNKIRRHNRTHRRQKEVSIFQAGFESPGENAQGGLEKLVSEELKQIITIAMKNLKTRHRAVLTMRCYDEMPYSQIAELMGCSQFGARMLFLRAKRSLAKQLSRYGLGKSALLTTLIVFGKLTAPNEAAAAQISVTTATLKVGTAAGIAGFAASKTALVTLATAGLLTVGNMVIESPTQSKSIVIHKKSIKSLPVTPRSVATSKGNQEGWYFFPEGPGGSVMIRSIKYDSRGKASQCTLLQNDRVNYLLKGGTVYINNFRSWEPDFSVKRLPTDPEGLTEFLWRMEGNKTDYDNWDTVKYVPAQGPGLLAIAKCSGENSSKDMYFTYHRNVLSEDYFQYDWHGNTKKVDNRDTMHKRGWTFFRISGRVNEKEVSGTGRLPFVYQTSAQFYPWLRLQAGDHRLIDAGSGKLFKGLPRPWMGLHTIDTIRRDAAEQHIWFETEYSKQTNTAQVSLKIEDVNLIYTIDMEKDVVVKIEFAGDITGELNFSYLEEINDVTDEFNEPRVSRLLTDESKGILWLIDLAQGQLD
jgi:RNA polymerase sigma factor (sigma-70 family)